MERSNENIEFNALFLKQEFDKEPTSDDFNDVFRAHAAKHDLRPMAAFINQGDTLDSEVCTVLVNALSADNDRVVHAAINFCKLLQTTHLALLDALAAGLSRDICRQDILTLLIQKRWSSPAILDALLEGILTIKEPRWWESFTHQDFTDEALKAFEAFGIADPRIIHQLIQFLADSNTWVCFLSLKALKAIGHFDPIVMDAVRNILNTSVSFTLGPTPADITDEEYLIETRDIASRYHAMNVLEAQRIIELAKQHAIVYPPSPLTNRLSQIEGAEDERILAWFDAIDFQQFRIPLQVFWCIVFIEQSAVDSSARALGWSKLSQKLEALKPRFAFDPLPHGVTYLRKECLPVLEGLFDREPFYSNAWDDAERGLDLRDEMNSKKPLWTLKARAAARYADRVLTLRGLLPDIASGTIS